VGCDVGSCGVGLVRAGVEGATLRNYLWENVWGQTLSFFLYLEGCVLTVMESGVRFFLGTRWALLR